MIFRDLFSLFDRLDFDDLGWASSAKRLVHGRGRQFPGFENVTIEWFPPYLIIFLHRPLAPEITASIKEYFAQLDRPQIHGIFMQTRDLGKAFWEILKGPMPDKPVVVREGPFQFLIKLGRDQNIGLFLDMAPLRLWLLLNSSGKTVLNLFSYTCALSVAAAKGQARQVHNVDMRKNFLTWGRENHTLNQCQGSFFYHPLDILKSFGRLTRLGPFDLIIIDPPSHQESFSLERNYARILKRVPEWLSPGGTLVLVANDPVLARDNFRSMAEQALGPLFQFLCWGDGPTIPLGTDANFPVKVAFYKMN